MSLIYDKFDGIEGWATGYFTTTSNGTSGVGINVGSRAVDLLQFDIDTDSTNYAWTLFSTTASASNSATYVAYPLNVANSGVMTTTIFLNGQALSGLNQLSPMVWVRNAISKKWGIMGDKGIATIRLAPSKLYMIRVENYDAATRNFTFNMLIREMRA